MKYKNLKELKQAYDSGELDKTLSPLILDNDCAYAYVNEKSVYGSDEPPMREILAEALNMLGIPSEAC